MRMNRIVLAALIVALPGVGSAQMAMDHAAMTGPMGEMMAAMDHMMDSMPRTSAGTADADFLLMMIPHHQAALDMARVELAAGKDDETRALAQAIIAAQEAEIAQMRGMLERMGVEPPPQP